MIGGVCSHSILFIKAYLLHEKEEAASTVNTLTVAKEELQKAWEAYCSEIMHSHSAISSRTLHRT